MLNKITKDDKFWDQPLEETYGELVVSVHTKGVYKGWTLSIIEGLHRSSGFMMRDLCTPLNLKDAILRPNTLTENDFHQNKVGTNKTHRSERESSDMK